MDTAAAVAPVDTDALVERVQDLQAQLEATGDSPARELAEELVSAVVQMYGAGLERVLEALLSGGEGGERIAASLAQDPLVATLLLIHDLHPVPLEQRVQGALDSVRPYMESHGGNVELLSVRDGIARIHLQGSCSDCSASAVTLELAIKQALEDAAPDLEGLEVEGVKAQTAGGPGLPMVTGSLGPPTAPTGLELPVVMSGPSWVEVQSLETLAEGALTAVRVRGSELVVASVEGTLLAYRNRCAACGGALSDGLLSSGALACPGCGRSFFLPRAGRSLDDEQLQLEPVPLLREDGHVRVAL
jgi:Fe-S cluster biogenesis protein NfuA/nitrite reductase/ring-hydroxylating ferredoxin subunit